MRGRRGFRGSLELFSVYFHYASDYFFFVVHHTCVLGCMRADQVGAEYCERGDRYGKWFDDGSGDGSQAKSTEPQKRIGEN